MSTQSTLGDTAGGPAPDSGKPSRAPIFWGIIAILGGLLLILTQFMDLDAIMPWIVLFAGLAMMVWGIFARSAGGLIPGGIVTGVGVGLTLVGPERMDASDAGVGYFLLCLALGFLSIPLSTSLLTDHRHWWAFIPGGIIFVVGLAMIFGGPFFQALTLIQLGGALALVALGAWLIYQYANRDQGET